MFERIERFVDWLILKIYDWWYEIKDDDSGPRGPPLP